MNLLLVLNNKRTIFLLAFIFFLGLFLRFYQLGEVPVSLHRDEATLGYNAFSILKTGKDMGGNFLPLHIDSFLFSPAGYSYFSIPFIFLFGLNEFSVRFASAFFGILTVPIVFLIAQNLFNNSKNKDIIAFSSAVLLAISPWYINLSRTASENTIVTFFICLGVYLYILFIKSKNKIYLFLGFVSLALTLFIYQAPRAFLPIFIPFMLLSLNQHKNIYKNKIIIGFLFILLIIFPIVFILGSKDLSLRITTLSIFTQKEAQLVAHDQRLKDFISGIPLLPSVLFHNKITSLFLIFLDNYFKHFSFDFLFLDGSFPQRYKIPNMGLLYLFELPLLVIALLKLSKKYKRELLFLAGWILISVVGSALAFDDVPNMQRTLMGMPAFSILSGYGAVFVFTSFKKYKPWGKIAIGFFLILVFYNFFYYLVQYYSQGRLYRPWYRQDGYKELVSQVNNLMPSFEKAVITNRESYPTIFFLFYSKYDPAKFQEETYRTDIRYSDHISFGRFEFSQEECPLKTDVETKKITGRKNILYVNSALCKEDLRETKLIKTIKRVDDTEVFKILKLE